MISIFEYFELLCYSQIIDNVNDEYKIDINQEEIDKINLFFEDNNNTLISKTLLATIVRKFISRFLSGKRGENEIKEDENLLFFIRYKEDFWPKEIFNDKKFNEEFDQMIKSFLVNVNQAIKFYDVLGGDKELLGDKKEFEILEKKDNNEINTDGEKKNKFDNDENEYNHLIEKEDIDLKKKKKKKQIHNY